MDREYWERRLGRGADLSTVGYLGLGQAYNRWMYRVRSGVFKRMVRASGVAVQKATILDVGSGSGFYLDQWLQLGATPTQLTGSDLTEVAVRSLRNAFPRSPWSTSISARPP